jgi:hypothetical protein
MRRSTQRSIEERNSIRDRGEESPSSPKRMGTRENAMNGIVSYAALIIFVSAFGVSWGFAMGGGDLSPEESPYAILAPSIVAPSVMIDGRAAYTNGNESRAPDHGPADACSCSWRRPKGRRCR